MVLDQIEVGFGNMAKRFSMDVVGSHSLSLANE